MSIIPDKFIPVNYQQCKLSVMDNISDNNIQFDKDGISNYYHDYLKFINNNILDAESKEQKFKQIVDQIKLNGKGKKYDCLIGLSGGADSSYIAYLAKLNNLRPLVVHFDYGWNTDAAISNIENIINKLGFELYTYVIDWKIIRDLQRSYYKSSVVDLDVPADHTIFGAIFHIANKFGIKTILSGSNYQTEFVMPPKWNYLKTDLKNIQNIHSKFGDLPFKNIHTNGIYDQLYYWIKGIRAIPFLYYVDYNQEKVYDLLKKELDWKDYGAKHFENVFTRFYQGYVLPNKFGIDKRKAHLSNLIFSGQLNKEEALNILSMPPYDPKLQIEDKEYIAKKLGFTIEEFDTLLKQDNIEHIFYGSDYRTRKSIFKFASFFLTNKYKKILFTKLLNGRHE
jgi:N-acetyl sugar amidotransferase